MKWPLVKALLWALVVFLHILENRGCFEEERIDLLKLKAFLKSNTHENNLLPSWEDNAKSDCCGWERVTCNSTTGRAIELSLARVTHPELDPDLDLSFIYGPHPFSCKDRWLLNVSLFMSFTELTSLDLSFNAIGGCLLNEGFEKLSSLKSLRNFNLGYNCLGNNGILQSLVDMTSLETLNLTSNNLHGEFSTQGSKNLSTFENLETLDLSDNLFNSTSIIKLLSSAKSIKNLNLAGNGMIGYFSAQGSKNLSTLENLETLDLSDNLFNSTSIIELLSSAKSIKNLNLAGNVMIGYFSAQGSKSLSTFENLETLDLSDNFFNNRSIIELLSSAKSIKTLNLAWNGMIGYFSAQGSKSLSTFKNLETLDLSDNFVNNTSIIELLSLVKSIKNLNLAGNGMIGYFSAQGSKSLSTFENLETLDLSDNFFNNTSIIELLSSAKSIKNLNLAWNGMIGYFSAQELSNFKSLEMLDLSDNKLSGSIIFQGLANLSRLEILHLEDNDFTGSISLHIGALSSLKALSLSSNRFNGTFPQELCGLVSLEELHLDDNLFKGILPPCLKNLTSLRRLDISRNQFLGNISLVALGIPKSIMYMDFRYNNFEGMLQFSLFANHSKLEVFSFISENNFLEIETENPKGWNPLFQLRVLFLPNCNLNKLTHIFPRFLFNQHKFERLDLSHNQLKGGFPTWLLENNIRLQRLNLRNNSFTRTLHLPIGQNLKHLWIDVLDNHLDGKFQEDINELSSSLNYLNLSRNSFEGYLPSSITKICQLKVLDLSFNNFFGELPKEWNCSSNYLVFLKLSNNQFNGTIPKSLFEISLSYFDVSNNNMSGPIPQQMQRISFLLLRNNSFKGQVPCNLGTTLILDLSYNSFSGLLPSCLNIDYIQHLLLQGNKLIGPLPKSIFNSSSLLTLDLSNNNLFGSLHHDMGKLSTLKTLLLRNNHFSGILPNELCWLKYIDKLDLSENMLFGSKPKCLHNMSFGNIRDNDHTYTSQSGNILY